VGQEDTRVSIDVGPGVLGLAGLEQDVGNEVVDLADELEVLVLGEVLESKFTLGGVTGIGLAEHSVAVTRDDLTTLEGRPDVFLDGLVGGRIADLGLHLPEPDEDLLVGETVEGTSKTVESGTVG
jgi:hypothetical protein